MSESFASEGWLLLHLAKKGPESAVQTARTALLGWLRESWIPRLEQLEQYHLHVDDDELHIRIQNDLSDRYQQAGFGPAIIEESAEFFKGFIGPDLHVQKFPYLRMARPGKRQDNIGIHRDTHYGGSPYELSVSVPFTDTGSAGALGVWSGSHVMSEEVLPVTHVDSGGVEKGSVKHKLGFLYAPKELPEEVRRKVTPVPVRVGEALVFSLSLVHGQELNASQVTRFQSDIRVVSSLAPIQWERTVHQDYYRPLSSSPVTVQARLYYEANRSGSAT